MALEPITEAFLRQRLADQDAACHAEQAAVTVTHPFLPHSTLEVASVVSNSQCEGDNCEEAGVQVLDRQTLRPRSICRDCINTARRDSLCHVDTTVLCYACKLKFDAYGFVIGATHSSIYIPDLSGLLAADRIVRDTETGIISILDAPAE